MRVALHLLRRHALLYSIWWGVMYCVLALSLISFVVLGPWVVEVEYGSAWSLPIAVAPGWFLFVMGLMAASTQLPIAIANGVTRRDFCLGAALFAVASAVLFELIKTVGLLVEALAYKIMGIMDQLTVPYPWPSAAGALGNILGGLAFMASGWLMGLAFYRLRVWWALLLMPLASIPLSSGMEFKSFGLPWTAVAGVVVVAAAVGYLGARGLPVKPRKG